MEIKSIEIYENIRDLLEDYMPEILEGLPEDISDAVASLAEWDGLKFYVIDTAPRSSHENSYSVIVADGLNGDAQPPIPLADFAALSIQEAKEMACLE